MVFSQKQMEYMREATKRWNFKTGATRSGKSYMDIAFMIPFRIRERAGKSGLNVILGVTKATIERNVLQPMREIYGPELVGTIGSDNIATIFGEEVYCLGAEKVNQITKIRGASFKYVYGDEVAEWSQDVWDIIPSRMDKEYSCFDGALNPQGTNHWLKLWIEEEKRKGASMYVQEYTIFDNPFLSEEFVKNLCLEYEGTVFYDRYILGKWVNAEGLIYLTFANDNKAYEITEQEAMNKKYIAINIGHDFGGNLSNHAFCCTGITEDYELIALKSVSHKASGVDFNKLFDYFLEFTKECINKWGFRGGDGNKYIDDIYCDSAEQTMINTYKNNTDFPIRNAIKSEIIDRIRCLTILISTHRFFYVKNQNDCLVDALNTACWSEDKDNVRVDNGSFNNDILDAIEYSYEYYMRDLVEFFENSSYS